MDIKIRHISFLMSLVLLFTSFAIITYAKPVSGISWYYDQLSFEAKEFYDLLKEISPQSPSITIAYNKNFNSKEEFFNFCSSKVKAFYQATSALNLDSVDFYWLKKEYSYTINTSTIASLYSIKLTLHCKVNEAFENNFQKAELDYLSAIQAVPVYGQNRYEKLKSIYDYICKNVSYAYGLNNYTSYAALVNKKAVCEGYARAFKAVCDYYDLPCVLVRGQAVKDTGTENHMWNYVMLEDGKWYAIDSTWGDQIARINYDYFLVGKDSKIGNKTFSQTHVPNNLISSYTISSSNFKENINISFDFPNLSSSRFEKKNASPNENDSFNKYQEFFASKEDIQFFDDIAYLSKANQTLSNVFNQNSSFDYFVYNQNGDYLNPNDKLTNGSKIIIYKNGVQVSTIYAIIKGDVDADGSISASDARLALRASAKIETLDEFDFLAADINIQKTISAANARKILRVASRIDSF